MEILGIDIGGTGIKAGIVQTSSGELLGERIRVPTPQPATPDAIGNAVEALIAQHQWHGLVGIGFPAALQGGIARTAKNIDRAFLGVPVADFLSHRAGRRVHVVNDTDAAGIAEMRFGAGKDHTGVVLIITIGTGIGTALFTEGHLLPNTELGHIYLENGVESEKYASQAVRTEKKLSWKEWGGRFNLYLTTMEHHFWPDLIILGGGASKKLHKFESAINTQAPFVAATFLNQAGIVGAALFAEDEEKRRG